MAWTTNNNDNGTSTSSGVSAYLQSFDPFLLPNILLRVRILAFDPKKSLVPPWVLPWLENVVYEKSRLVPTFFVEKQASRAAAAATEQTRRRLLWKVMLLRRLTLVSLLNAMSRLFYGSRCQVNRIVRRTHHRQQVSMMARTKVSTTRESKNDVFLPLKSETQKSPFVRFKNAQGFLMMSPNFGELRAQQSCYAHAMPWPPRAQIKAVSCFKGVRAPLPLLPGACPPLAVAQLRLGSELC